RGVRRVIARLGELLRHNLERGGDAEATLRDELGVLARYVEIMQVRFQGRLTVDTHADDAIMDALVPTMILQPIVENAIKHGAERIVADARIEISATREGDDVVIRVRDNGPGVTPAAEGARTGVGLGNSRARLEQLYGGGQRLTVNTHPDGGAVAEMRVPYHVQPVRGVEPR
ncbi:MAG: ATP-binding protein, partial [Gemmatimonadaceae bacterium]